MINRKNLTHLQIGTWVGLVLYLATGCSPTPKPNAETSKSNPNAEAAAELQRRANEGRIYVAKVTLAQLEYHKSHAKYASDLKALLTEQKIDVKTESENYTYSTAESAEGKFYKVFTMTAIPKRDDLPSIIGVSYVNATVTDTYIASTSERHICETLGPSKTPPKPPVVSGLNITCAPGTQESKW